MLTNLLIAILYGWASSAIINYLADTLPVSNHECPSLESRRPIHQYYFYNPFKIFRIRKTRIIAVQICAIASYFAALQFSYLGITVAVMDAVIIAFYFLVIVIDFEHHLVLHRVTLVGGIIFLLFGILTHRFLPTLLGMIAGTIFFFIIYLIGQIYSSIKTRRTGLPVDDAIGFGDVTLSLVCGLLIGWPGIIPVLIYGIALGGGISLLYLVFQRIFKKKDVSQSFIAYGPYISLSTMIFWFFTR